MKPISIGKQIVSGFGFINHFFDPDSKIDHVVIVSHSCAIPELTNLLKANPLQLYILAKVFTFHFLKPKKVLEKISQGKWAIMLIVNLSTIIEPVSVE